MVPNKAPTAAVSPMASAPQKVTRTADLRIGAPPAIAARVPNPARNKSDVPETIGTNKYSGDIMTIRRGIEAPTAKVAPEANAAWTGRALK